LMYVHLYWVSVAVSVSQPLATVALPPVPCIPVGNTEIPNRFFAAW
jgi:hypothetical protein